METIRGPLTNNLTTHHQLATCKPAEPTASGALQVKGEDQSAMQMEQDIEVIQNLFHAVTSIKGKNVILNERAANALMSHYFSLVPFEGKISKNKVAAALRRRLFEIIICSLTNRNDTQSIVDGDMIAISHHNRLELEISATTDTLTDLLLDFGSGKDDTMKRAAQEVRQKVFSTMGSYNVSASGKLVRELHSRILNEMDTYRTTLAVPDRISQDAENLVVKMVSLFYQFKCQGIREVVFIGSGERFDPQIMDVEYPHDDEDDEHDFQVDLCYFPLISAVDAERNETVISKAKVLLHPLDQPILPKEESTVYPLVGQAVQQESVRPDPAEPMDGFDILQPITKCWRTGTSNCEPEKALLRKERDEWKENCEVIQESFQAYQRDATKHIQKLEQREQHGIEERGRLTSELNLCKQQLDELMEEAQNRKIYGQPQFQASEQQQEIESLCTDQVNVWKEEPKDPNNDDSEVSDDPQYDSSASQPDEDFVLVE